MPFINVYIHFVWSTKNRVKYFSSKEIRQKIWNHIKENAKSKYIHLDFINGYEEHCHCLISLGADQSISKIMQLIKGESAHWINLQCEQDPNFLSDNRYGKFIWQEEYYAVSVSESKLNRVREYIKNQEEHHTDVSFDDEVEVFMKKHKFKRYKD